MFYIVECTLIVSANITLRNSPGTGNLWNVIFLYALKGKNLSCKFIMCIS